MRIATAFVVLSLLAAPAFAAEGAKEKGPAFIDLNMFAIPVVKDGRLVNYVFVKVRVNLTAKADPNAFRAKTPFVIDALVKTAHRQSLIDPKDPTRVDEKVLNALVAREAARVAGPGVVASGQVMSQVSQGRVLR